jgi:hypothetical protein
MLDEALQVGRRAQPRRRGEEADHLVAPRRHVGVLLHAHQLDVRVLHVLDVRHQLAARAKAAEGLASPSSAVRALFGGAEHIEGVDHLIHRLARQQGLQSDTLDGIVILVDERLAKNRAANSPKRS